MKKLYVGNLAFTASEDDLRDLFGEFGEVTNVNIIQDRETQRSRGFGFVEMESGAEEAIAALDGTEFKDRELKVNEAKEKEDRGGSRGGDRRGGGGGFRGADRRGGGNGGGGSRGRNDSGNRGGGGNRW
ncbi:UNVERIFIED_CONTAM: hypothetical protein GTU68_016590 [Idotea baltica]|nr:hypothetical protein [Idotea baltica]